LPALGSAAQRLSESEDAESDKTDERDRDIMLVIAGGEGYIDFRQGIRLTFSTPCNFSTGVVSKTISKLHISKQSQCIMKLSLYKVKHIKS